MLKSYANDSKWVDTRFENVKRILNTLVGQVGQDFVELLWGQLEFDCEFPEDAKGKRMRNSPWDIKIEGSTFELKTASEDVSGAFQFNHIRFHREYEALLCIGISPSNIYVETWTKADVAQARQANWQRWKKVRTPPTN